MKILVITASPNTNGLTATCGEAAVKGAVEAGAEVAAIRLNDLTIGKCLACSNGWGPCREKHECQFPDDFQTLHAQMCTAGGIVLVTPVYWGEMSEPAKTFTDKLRRCEATKGEQSGLVAKPIICIAAAGGSGNGCISCLASMERFVDHVRAKKFDFIGVTRISRAYKITMIREAVNAMVAGVTP